MAKVRVIISTVRYGTNGYKHKGDEFNLPDVIAEEKVKKGLVEYVKENKEVKESKELKEEIKTK